jgi:hypothetical protein
VDHLEREHEVVRAGRRVAGQVARHVGDVEVHALAHAGVGGVLASGGNGGLVVVEAVDGDVGPCLGDRDRGPALAAADLCHARAGLLQPLDDARHRRQPRRRQQVQERRPVEVTLRVVDRVVRVRDTAARPEGVHQRRDHSAERHDEVEQRSGRSQALRAEQALLRRRRQHETAGVGVVAVLGQLDQAGRGLLLEPLAGVPRVDASASGELGGRGGLDELVVQAEVAAERHRHRLEGGQPGDEESLGVGTDGGFEVGVGSGLVGHGVGSCDRGGSVVREAPQRIWRCQIRGYSCQVVASSGSYVQ